jgi:hypothetical protein
MSHVNWFPKYSAAPCAKNRGAALFPIMRTKIFLVLTTLVIALGSLACDRGLDPTHSQGAAVTGCTPNMTDSDPSAGAMYNALLENGAVAAVGETTTSTGADGAEVAEQGLEINAGGVLLAGTLSCALSGCGGLNCTRSGCVPNAAKTDCTTCTCSDPGACNNCACTRTITVENAAMQVCMTGLE